MTKFGLGLLIILPVFMQPALANEEKKGIYLSADLGASNSSIKRFSRDLSETECDISNATVSRCDYTTNERSFAGGLGLGYQAGKYIAFELSYFDLINDKSTLETTATAIIGNEPLTVDATQTLDTRLAGFGIRGIATIPIADKLTTEIHFGLSRLNYERNEWAQLHWQGSSSPDEPIIVQQQDSQVSPFVGLGLNYRLSNHIEIRATALSFALAGDENPSSPLNGRSLTTATIGLVYRF